MKKKLIRLYVPALSVSYDILVPVQVRLYEMIPLLSKAVEEDSEGQYESSGKEILCTKEEGKILDINYSVGELGIANGATLILI